MTPHKHDDDDDDDDGDDHSLRIINIHNLKRNRGSRLVIRKFAREANRFMNAYLYFLLF